MADKETLSILSRRSFLKVAAAAGAAAAASAAGLAPAFAAGRGPTDPKDKMDIPTISCAGSTQTSINIEVCAGSTTGAPAGFSIQWMTKADYTANGWADETNLCSGSFSGNASGHQYDLGPSECVTVTIGVALSDNGASTTCPSPLVCDTVYVFRAFAHGNSTLKRSDFTANLTCSTLSCGDEGGCTYTQGYWGNKPGIVWPSSYSRDAAFYLSGQTWQQVLDTPVNVSQGYYQLAHQYIAAVLNKANGASVPSGVQDVLDLASAWFEENVPDACAASGSCGTQKDWAATLDLYNNGDYPDGPPHCGDE